jgi:hypothetical protein
MMPPALNFMGAIPCGTSRYCYYLLGYRALECFDSNESLDLPYIIDKNPSDLQFGVNLNLIWIGAFFSVQKAKLMLIQH